MKSRTPASPLLARLACLAFAAFVSACGGGGGGGTADSGGSGGGGTGPLPPGAFPGKVDVSFAQEGLFDTRGLLGGRRSLGYFTDIAGDGSLFVAGVAGSPGGFERSLLLLRLASGGAPDPAFGQGGQVQGPRIPNRSSGPTWAFALDGGKAVIVEGRFEDDCPPLLPCPEPDLAIHRVAADGSPDPSYPRTVFARTSARQALAEPDGSILVAGAVQEASGRGDYGLRRVAADGRADDAFASRADAALPCLATSANGVSLQNRMARLGDGRILVMQWNDFPFQSPRDAPNMNPAAPASPRLACLARLNPDGTPDTTFGTGGRLQLDDGWREAELAESVVEVLPRPDGGIAIVMNARVSYYSPPFGAVLWLASNGAVQAERGVRGLTKLGTVLGTIQAAAIQADGRIVLAGYLPGPAPGFYRDSDKLRVVRLDAGGAFDREFGPDGDGVAPIVFRGKTFGDVASVRVSPAGPIYLTGWVYYALDWDTAYNLAVAKLFGGTR